MEDQIIDIINKMAGDFDLSHIDRIEIDLTDGIVDINIESNQSDEDITTEELKSEDKDMSYKTMINMLLLTPFRKLSQEFFTEVYDLIDTNVQWVETFNRFFADVAETNKLDYTIQVISN